MQEKPFPTTEHNRLNYKADIPPYQILLASSSSVLTLTIYEYTDSSRKQYQSSLGLTQLIACSKWFHLFNSIEAIANELTLLFKANWFEIKKGQDILSLLILIQSRVSKDVLLDLPLIEVSKDKLLSICFELNLMNRTLKSHSEKFEVLEKSSTYHSILDRAIAIQNHKGLLTDDIKELIEGKLSLTHVIKYDLLFSALIDGDSASTFHSLCDNYGPTLTIIKTSKDIVVGGYSPISWDSSNTIKKYDRKTFLFSASFKQIYSLSSSYCSIQCYSSFGPKFGNTDIEVPEKFFSYQSRSYYNFDSKVSFGSYSYYQQYFNVKELEVYKVTITKERKTIRTMLLLFWMCLKLNPIKTIIIGLLLLGVIIYLLTRIE